MSERELLRAAEKTWTLARFAPDILRREAARKIRTTLSRATYAGRATPATEIAAASRRADV